ncbi:mechanosensitive ion channel family protein [Chloroflexota bacterium]
MTIDTITNWINQNPLPGFGVVLLASVVCFFIARLVIARGLVSISERTKTEYDDIIVEHLRPFRVAWIVPLLMLNFFAYLLPNFATIIQTSAQFLILWIITGALVALITALNQIYESSPIYKGVSIQSYLDILKILLILVGLIMSISLFTGESPLVLLSGLGALTAVLLLIFRDTILAFVASLQIASNDLFKEGDWLEVPGFGADGDVIDITLHAIKIQNFDKTITVIPTNKVTEVAFKNWRGMQESGGRRIKRSLYVDINSIDFCTPEQIEEFKQVSLLKDYLEEREKEIEQHNLAHEVDTSMILNGRQFTNIGIFRKYIEEYLRENPKLHQAGMTMLVRQLAPSAQGLPLEIYTFAKTTVWADYELIQADMFDHLVAASRFFGLRLFQEPTGADFGKLIE